MKALRGKAVLLAIVFAVVSLLSLVLDRAEALTPLRNLVLQVTTPIQWAVSGVVTGIGETAGGIQDLGRLRVENRRLSLEVDDLRARVVRLQEAEIENRSLREELGFKQAYPAYDLLPAEVVGRDPSNYLQYLQVDKGTADGVRVGAVAVAPQGLLGRVVAAGSNFCRILLVNDSSSSVNVLLQSSRASGVASGQFGGTLLMKYIPQGEVVRLGDMVLTSGLGGNFPKGLVVGQVSQVRQKDIELFQEAVVESLIDFRRLEVVYLIRNFTPQRME
ncbi:MAG: rod shape-determining protein MreC [Chloroflexota bacterium]|nr:rod shape-determining protein MreC [Chloroflexota bacterium]